LTTPVFRWGILGPGRIAEEFATALAAVDDACLYCVASRNRARAQKFARHHGASVYYDNYEALISDPAVDGVYIATPHRFHFQQARDCILGGKAVLCEKPLTVNSGEAQELISLARETGTFLMEAMRTRYLPIYYQVQRWLQAQKIGTIESVRSSFGFEFPRNDGDRLLNHDLAGGVLLDMGVYNLSMSQWIFGSRPESSSIQSLLGVTGVDEHNEVTLLYSGGRSSTFTNSMTTRLDNDLTIFGSSGRITIQPMFWNATQATLTIDAGAADSNEQRTVSCGFRATGLEYEIEEAVDCILTGELESPGMSLDDTLDTMKLMDQLRSAMGLTYKFE
jgi:dihydrodiol dehydrogenase / D-xylose 1-dehydrogenase (NADP)